MTDIDRRLLLGLAGVASASLAAKLAQAGSLNPPPGPVAPTGKTTDQIEPRIDLMNAPASANVTSGSGYHYIINKPGSYYLSSNLAVTMANGIYVNTHDVTLDLCGFSISRGSGSGGTAIAAFADYNNTFLNGTLRGFDTAFETNAGCRFEDLTVVDCANGFGVALAMLSRCRAQNCSEYGFAGSNTTWVDCLATSCGKGFVVGDASALTRCYAGGSTDIGFSGLDGCRLDGCIAQDGHNDAPAAFQFGNGCTLTSCSAIANTVQYGFVVGNGCTLIGCTAQGNTSAHTVSAGYYLGGSIARDCAANGQATTTTATNSTGAGFFAGLGGNRIEGCIANGNSGDGFSIGFESVVARNAATHNAFAGVHASGGSIVVEGNRVVANTGNGILVEGTVNLVFGNSARNNTAGNYSIVANNRVGAIVVPALNASAISGNSGGSAITTDPYANIAF